MGRPVVTTREAGRVEQLVRDTGLLPPPGGTDAVVVLCSGGRDSSCLLDLVVRISGPEAVTVLHVDHGLRDESSEEGAAVALFAGRLGVSDVRLLHAGPPPVTGNLHDWGRHRRRGLSWEVGDALRRAGRDVRVAMAHTRTDLVETTVGRLASQPGRRALLAMAAENRLPAPAGAEGGAALPLVRPLLEISREETTAYCRSRGLEWREDPSNAERRFARARLRHEVLPVLRSLNPQAEAAIARTIGELREESEALDALVEAELGAADAGGAGTGGVARARLAELPPPIARLVLRALCERSIGRPVPQVTARLDDVLTLAAGGELDVGAGARLRVSGGVVTCVPSQGPAAPAGR